MEWQVNDAKTSFVADIYCTVISVYGRSNSHDHGIEENGPAQRCLYVHADRHIQIAHLELPILERQLKIGVYSLISGLHITLLVLSLCHCDRVHGNIRCLGQYGMSGTPRNWTGLS